MSTLAVKVCQREVNRDDDEAAVKRLYSPVGERQTAAGKASGCNQRSQEDGEAGQSLLTRTCAGSSTMAS